MKLDKSCRETLFLLISQEKKRRAVDN